MNRFHAISIIGLMIMAMTFLAFAFGAERAAIAGPPVYGAYSVYGHGPYVYGFPGAYSGGSAGSSEGEYSYGPFAWHTKSFRTGYGYGNKIGYAYGRGYGDPSTSGFGLGAYGAYGASVDSPFGQTGVYHLPYSGIGGVGMGLY